MFRSLLSIVLSLLLIALPAWAVPAGDQPAGEVKALIPDASRNAHPLAAKDTLQWNDLLKTDARGRVRVGLTDGSILSVGSNSELKVVRHDASAQQTLIEMNYGKLRNQVVKITSPGGKYEVKTPNAVAGVIGTDFYVAYELNAYTDAPREVLNIFSDLHRNIQDKFNEAGVEICSPHFSALRDANTIAIPEQYVKPDYKAPSFRVELNQADAKDGSAS